MSTRNDTCDYMCNVFDLSSQTLLRDLLAEQDKQGNLFTCFNLEHPRILDLWTGHGFTVFRIQRNANSMGAKPLSGRREKMSELAITNIKLTPPQLHAIRQAGAQQLTAYQWE